MAIRYTRKQGWSCIKCKTVTLEYRKERPAECPNSDCVSCEWQPVFVWLPYVRPEKRR